MRSEDVNHEMIGVLGLLACHQAFYGMNFKLANTKPINLRKMKLCWYVLIIFCIYITNKKNIMN